ncbi:MAG TPA: hypothetical protein VLH19_04270 [Patescibacteria group bacterium]|nr:hypothetical protein [Patescibacteria group bacterium]
MRIVVFFFKTFAFLGISALFVYTLGAQAWILIAAHQFEQDVKSLPRMSRDAQKFTQICQNAPASSENSQPLAFQLRFRDSNAYAIEILCSLIPDPVLVREGKLLPFVTKDPGSSGFYYAVEGGHDSSVRISFLTGHQTLQLLLDSVKFVSTIPDIGRPLPQTSCQGFGYACCTERSDLGRGQPLSDGVLDCPNSCFPSCQSVPFVQTFVSEPLPDDAGRIIMTSNTQEVLFSYAVSSTNGKIAQVTIDYGDGTKDTSQLSVGVFTHTFTCSGPCTYTTIISGVDSLGKKTQDYDGAKTKIVRL